MFVDRSGLVTATQWLTRWSERHIQQKENAVDSTVTVLVVILVLVALGLAAVGVMLIQRRRTERLQELYGLDSRSESDRHHSTSEERTR
jgi:uncharacterized protein HemX